ncbi:trypsin-like peptidase domain-containing protein [Streptomyces sp. NPDC048110]|uniref:trypsin-like peptidase domain-containing protein n=1 Tax=Streptomyces sp. NPDC048110 TaxID=3155483 RepID=UPI003401318F
MAAGGGEPAASPMKTPSWAVRIRGADGEIAGAGILLTPDQVLTCAHVVDRAAARLTAEFVGATDHSVPAVPARVDGTAYVPETRDADGDPSGDVALLRLERPRPAEETVRLHRLSAPGREVRMYGFPYAHNGGIWFRSTVVGGCGRDGQVQLSPVSPGELASPGCSGAGVADSRTGEVIGMVLSGQLDQHGNRFSFMSPAETIARHLPGLKPHIVGPTAVDERLLPTDDGPSPDLLDEPFAQRLAAWLRDDGNQVKISVVGPGDAARAATLRRAITLADRELRTAVSIDRASLDPPGTVPSAGGHDLAVDASGVTAAEIAERIADRMGLWQHPEDPPLDRIRASRSTLNLVVVGVDEAIDPLPLLDLLEVLRAGGSRLLLVFRTAGDCHRLARDRLLTRPARERRARLVERLRDLTGPLAEDLHDRLAAMVPHGLRPLDSDLVAAHAALADLLRADDADGERDPAGGPARDRDRDPHHPPGRVRGADRDSDRDGHWDPGRGRDDLDRDPDRDPHQPSGRVRGADRDSDRDGHRDPGRSRDDLDRDPDRDPHHPPGPVQYADRDPGLDWDPDRVRHLEPGRDRDLDPERGRDLDRDWRPDRGHDRDPDRDPHQPPGRVRYADRDPGLDWDPGRAPARVAGPVSDLGRYERLADRVAGRLAAGVAELDRLRDRRDELAGRLRGYHVLHQHSLQGEEDPAVDDLYLRAHALLRARPCDVRAAEAAVDAYTRRVDGHGGGDAR